MLLFNFIAWLLCKQTVLHWIDGTNEGNAITINAYYVGEDDKSIEQLFFMCDLSRALFYPTLTQVILEGVLQ